MGDDPWVIDVAFIVEEITRLRKADIKDIQAQNPHDLLCNIIHPEKGVIFLGTGGIQRLETLAASYLSRQKTSCGRIALPTLARELGKQIIDKFIDTTQPINHSNTMKVLHRSLKSTTSNIEDQTHFIPCHIVSRQEPGEFKIGPIRFLCYSRFEKQISPELETYRKSLFNDRLLKYPKLERFKEASPEQISKEAEEFSSFRTDGVTKYFSNFGWIAEVTVKGCDPDIASIKANHAVAAAIDVIRLFSKPGYANRMCIAPRSSDINSTRLSRPENGELNITIQQGGHSGEAVAGDWWDRLENAPSINLRMTQLGDIISTITLSAEESSLEHRILNALHWFGAGCQDDIPGAKIIKFVTSMESLVLLGNEENLTKKVVERAAALIFHDAKNDLEYWVACIDKIYDCRSKLVHGDISAYDQRVLKLCHTASLTSQYSLMGAIDFFHHLGIKSKNVSDKKLRENFNMLVKNARSLNTGGTSKRIPPFSSEITS